MPSRSNLEGRKVSQFKKERNLEGRRGCHQEATYLGEGVSSRGNKERKGFPPGSNTEKRECETKRKHGKEKAIQRQERDKRVFHDKTRQRVECVPSRGIMDERRHANERQHGREKFYHEEATRRVNHQVTTGRKQYVPTRGNGKGRVCAIKRQHEIQKVCHQRTTWRGEGVTSIGNMKGERVYHQNAPKRRECVPSEATHKGEGCNIKIEH